MFKTYPFSFWLLVVLLITSINLKGQVAINSTGTVPDASSMLDVSSSSMGILIPRVALTASNAAGPTTLPQTSLLVYNTATASSGATYVYPGYYYNAGTTVAPNWVRVATNKDAWNVIGNYSTIASNSGYGSVVNNNYIGTNDAIDFVLATNGLERMRIRTDDANNLRIGMGTAFTFNLTGAGNPSILHLHDWGTTTNDYSQLNISTSSVNVGRTGVLNFAATLVTNEKKTASIESYLSAYAAPNASGDLRFFTNNINSFTEKMRIQPDGKVGIGITAPTEQLHVYFNSNVSKRTIYGYAEQTSTATDYQNVGVYGFAKGGNATWGYTAGVMGVADQANSWRSVGVFAKLDASTPTLPSVDAALYSDGNNLGYSGIFMNGNVGIGVTNPAYNLEISGSFGFGNGTAGSYRSRTETRNDAGQIASQSGFYETSAPSPAASWPTGAGSWWHLIDCRHSNNGNNYAMQFSGSFFDQILYYRKTNSSSSQAWSIIPTTTSFGTSGQLLSSQGPNAQPVWVNPTSILVYGNNAQSIKLTNCVSTNSATFVDIPGMSITLNTQHNTIYIFASFTARLDNGSCSSAQYGQAIAFAQLVVDGVPQAIAGQIITDYDDVNGVVTTGTISFNGIPVTVAPGSHTIKIQWRRSWLWATGPAYILINPASGVGDHCVLTIFD